MHGFRDLTGQKFGSLTVLRPAPNDKHESARWHVLCKCGIEKVVARASLISGRTRSCGCLQREGNSQRIKHGHSRRGMQSSEHVAWVAMTQRTTNPDHPNYRHYGGRGIFVCERWLNGDGGRTGFECFLADVGPRPSKAHSLGRGDNDGPYSPQNCKWETRTEQMNNTRRCHRIPLDDGRVVSLTQLEREIGWPPDKLRGRIRSSIRHLARIQREFLKPLLFRMERREFFRAVWDVMDKQLTTSGLANREVRR